MTLRRATQGVSPRVVIPALAIMLVLGIVIGYIASQPHENVTTTESSSATKGLGVSLSGSIAMPLCDAPTNVTIKQQSNGQIYTTYPSQNRPYVYGINIPDKNTYSVTVYYLDTCNGGRASICAIKTIQVSGDSKLDFSC